MEETVDKFEVLQVRIDASKIAFLKFILEGYDNLAVLSTVDRDSGLVKMSFHPGCRSEVNALLDSLGQLEMVVK